jgi:hypothetical protein
VHLLHLLNIGYRQAGDGLDLFPQLVSFLRQRIPLLCADGLHQVHLAMPSG